MAAQRRKQNRVPSISPLILPDVDETDPDLLTAQGNYDAMRFVDADLSYRNLSGCVFLECEFVRPIADDTEFRSTRFSETRIDGMAAPVFRTDRAGFRDVVVANSRLGVVEASNTDIQSTLFDSCKLDFLNLRAAELTNVIFRNCRIGEVDFNGCTASRVAFEGCVIESLSLGQTRLENVDLRGADIGIINGLEGARGVTLSRGQVIVLAETFARHLGIAVEG